MNEHAALIASDCESDVSSVHSRTSDDTVDGDSTQPWWRRETGRMFHVGGLGAVIMLGRLAMMLTDIAMLGHLGSKYLAAAATGNIWINVTSFFVWRALASVLKTLSSAALGANNPHQAGEWLQVALFFGAISAVVLAGLWAASYYVFYYVFSLHDEDAHLAAKFVHYSMLQIPPLVLFSIFNNYFQAMNIIMPACVVAWSWVVLNAGCNLALIWGLPNTSFDGLHFIGSPLATSFCKWGQTIMFLAYTLWYKGHHKHSWGGWSYDAVFKSGKIGRFWKLMLPLGLGGLFEEGQLQTLAVMAVKLGQDEIAAHTTVLNLFIFLCAFMMGIRSAVNIRGSYYLGRGSLRGGRLVAKIGFCFALLIGFAVSGALLLGRDYIGRIFTSETHIDHLIKQILTLMSGCYILFGLMVVGMMVLMTLHKPGLVAVAYLIGCWCVGVPLAYVLGFTFNHGLLGIWYGMSAGYVVVTFIAFIAMNVIDLEKQTRIIHEIAREKVKLSPIRNDGGVNDVQEEA